MRLRSLTVTALATLMLAPATSVFAPAPALAASRSDATLVSRSAAGGWGTSLVMRRQSRMTRPPIAQSAVLAAQAYQNRVLLLTNAERRRYGLAPLALSRCADGFADSWAGRLAVAGALSHQRLSPVLSACAALSVGENVAYGNVTPEQLLAMWMASPGHRANILTASFTQLGVGAVRTSSGRWYGVQVFLRA